MTARRPPIAGTSRRQLGEMLHQLRKRAEGAFHAFVAVHEAAKFLMVRRDPHSDIPGGNCVAWELAAHA
jgi:hypothetical protein